MMENWELCFARNSCGKLETVKVPFGVAKPGMVLRLVGGSFLLAESVGRWEDGLETAAAAEILTPVWGRYVAG